MSWSLEIDANTCIGSGLCAGTAPDYFELDEGYGCPTKERVEPADEVRDAADACPVEAITVRDTETGERIAPTP